jgi:hypothetical protein
VFLKAAVVSRFVGCCRPGYCDQPPHGNHHRPGYERPQVLPAVRELIGEGTHRVGFGLPPAFQSGVSPIPLQPPHSQDLAVVRSAVLTNRPRYPEAVTRVVLLNQGQHPAS